MALPQADPASDISHTQTRAARPLLLGHRGASRYAAENTMAAFDLALSQGCDGFEFDARVTADGHMVVSHDAALRGVVVAEATLAKLLSAAKSPVPMLTDVLERYSQRAFLNLELKVTGLEEEVIRLLQQFSPKHGVLISSFLPEVLSKLAALKCEHPLGYICKQPRSLKLWQTLSVSHAVLHHNLISESVVRELRAGGKKLVVWTVNDEVEMRRFAAMQADGIISDDTRLLGRVFGAPENATVA